MNTLKPQSVRTESRHWQGTDSCALFPTYLVIAKEGNT